ncbi:hypothetical protein JKP88DRAFT_289532 [Tribonema minus]|uniref:Uncharacterized protein n=1 Tax=Tribonema minus TaxID=303371 RepID=A0A836CIP6_9STRA|nr:hypothetical protein JKP88DRAFT_289532 [Tribonema minus]
MTADERAKVLSILRNVGLLPVRSRAVNRVCFKASAVFNADTPPRAMLKMFAGLRIAKATVHITTSNAFGEVFAAIQRTAAWNDVLHLTLFVHCTENVPTVLPAHLRSLTVIDMETDVRRREYSSAADGEEDGTEGIAGTEDGGIDEGGSFLDPNEDDVFWDWELPGLPRSLAHLALSRCGINNVDGIHNDLETLSVGPRYTGSLGALPAALRKLCIGGHFEAPLGGLPAGLTHLTCFKTIQGCDFAAPLGPLPASLQVLDLSDCHMFNHPLPIPCGLRVLRLGSEFNQPLGVLPASLEVLEFLDWSEFNRPLGRLPDALRVLTTGKYFTEALEQLPVGLRFLEVGPSYNHPLAPLPEGLTNLRVLSDSYAQPLAPLPHSLSYLQISSDECEHAGMPSPPHRIPYPHDLKPLPQLLETAIVSSHYQYLDAFSERGIRVLHRT